MCCKMKVMKRILSVLFILFAAGVAFAQSADVVTDILESDEATYGQVCYLSAIHQGLISEEASYEDAVSTILFLWQTLHLFMFRSGLILKVD